jgi:hypothetical protein
MMRHKKRSAIDPPVFGKPTQGSAVGRSELEAAMNTFDRQSAAELRRTNTAGGSHGGQSWPGKLSVDPADGGHSLPIFRPANRLRRVHFCSRRQLPQSHTTRPGTSATE